jgi:hypothetical protein
MTDFETHALPLKWGNKIHAEHYAVRTNVSVLFPKIDTRGLVSLYKNHGEAR